ncbi:MAG: glycerophosphoryl diester phosphodiesterase membrane domain-containing protein [Tannerella sp.]|jgi:uncharacterized membrane protein|nr:glycerophosphoryl diester phosphodiesterase membrane domain-containing protein [Tannerella sp.]
MKEKINYSDIVRTAWKGLKSQFWLLTGLLIGFTIVYSLLFIFAIPAKGDFFSISCIITYILCVFLLCLFQLGYLKNCFQTLDGEEPQFSSYGQVSRKLPAYLAAYLIYSIIIAIGSVLFVIPGIYLALRLQFFMASIIDEDTGIIKSFKRSWEITKGHSMRLFVVMLIMLLISFIGQIALFVGIFVAIPLIVLTYGVVFRRLTTPAA